MEMKEKSEMLKYELDFVEFLEATRDFKNELDTLMDKYNKAKYVISPSEVNANDYSSVEEVYSVFESDYGPECGYEADYYKGDVINDITDSIRRLGNIASTLGNLYCKAMCNIHNGF